MIPKYNSSIILAKVLVYSHNWNSLLLMLLMNVIKGWFQGSITPLAYIHSVTSVFSLTLYHTAPAAA
jgi:hypothetical protein